MKEFLKRHKLLSLLFVVCIFLMIKNSSIPYLFDPPPIIAFIFHTPKGEFMSGIAAMVDIFTTAYVTSLIFYGLLDFRRTLKEEAELEAEKAKAKEIIGGKLVNLYLYINELLGMIRYSGEKQGLLYEDEYDRLDDLQFEATTVYCNKTAVINGEATEKAVYFYSLREDCDKYRTLIIDTCRDISGTPSFQYCPSAILHIISELQLSELLRAIPDPNSLVLKANFHISRLGFGNDYIQLENIRDQLKNFVEKRYDYVYSDITKEEYEAWKTSNYEALKAHPEIAKFIAIQEQEYNRKK